MFPPVPGMQLHVNPARLSYVISDPLDEDEDMCERIRKYLNTSSPFRTDARIRGVPTTKGSLDVHRMKTICRELFNLIKLGHVKVVKGLTPRMEDIEALPGNFLLNPGSRVVNTQPMFEKDWDKWVEQLTRSGG